MCPPVGFPMVPTPTNQSSLYFLSTQYGQGAQDTVSTLKVLTICRETERRCTSRHCDRCFESGFDVCKLVGEWAEGLWLWARAGWQRSMRRYVNFIHSFKTEHLDIRPSAGKSFTVSQVLIRWIKINNRDYRVQIRYAGGVVLHSEKELGIKSQDQGCLSKESPVWERSLRMS